MLQKYATALIVGAIIVGAVIIAGAIIYVGKTPNLSGTASLSPQSGETSLDSFAKCLTEKGAKLYGAWWCPHCQNQKNVFGSSLQYINYIECEKTPNVSRGDIAPACVEAEIEAYPTWIFSDGSRQNGEIASQTLSQITGCEIK